MNFYWNIHSESYDSLAYNIRRNANKVLRRDVVCVRELQRNMTSPQLLIAEGKAMTRKRAIQLVKYYCNTHGVFYNHNDLDELVDTFFGKAVEKKQEITAEPNRVSFRSYENNLEKYRQSYREKIVNFGNPWEQYAWKAA